jgi:hypothetical protein
MMKRILVSASLTAVLGVLTAVGCGGSSSNNGGGNTGSDAGGNNNPTNDAGGNNKPTADGGDSGSPSEDGGTTNPPLPPGSVLPHGNQLVQSGTLAVNGVTSDDYVIYTDLSTGTAFALSLAGSSKPISLGPLDDQNDVTVIGKVVLLGTTVNDNSGIGTTSIWTSVASAPAPLASATFNGQAAAFAVSADGSHIMYIDSVDTNVTTGTVMVAATDGTGKATLVPGVDLTDSFCIPQLGFAASSYAVLAYCVLPAGATGVDAGEPDGGTTVNLATVASYSAASSWAAATIASNVQDVFSVDKAGTKVAVNGAAGTLLYPIGGGSPLTIDAAGEIGSVNFTPGVFTSDGSHFLYTTNAQALSVAATTSPANPVALTAAGKFSDVLDISADGNWLIGPLNVDPNSGESDLYLTSATTPLADGGAPVTLTAQTTGGIFGNAFTADSTHALFLSSVNQGTGTLNAAAVASAGNPTALGTNAFADFATSTAQVVFNANYNGTVNNTNGAADILVVDTSQATAPTVLVTQADPAIALNAEKTLVVYTWSYVPTDTAHAGLWTLAP